MHHTEGCPNSWEYNIFTIGSVHTDTDYNTWKHQNFMRDIALISRENDIPCLYTIREDKNFLKPGPVVGERKTAQYSVRRGDVGIAPYDLPGRFSKEP